MAIGPHVSGEQEVLEPHELAGRVGNRLLVTVVTPKGTIVTRDVDEVIAPGAEGEFGVLPGHVPFLSALRSGVLTIRTGTERQVYAVGPGYLQVGAGGKTSVLVEMAIAGEAIDEDEARRDRAAAEEQQKAASTGAPGSVGLAQANLDWAQARLDARAAARR